jgi:pilus assembly protein Flp/PilA
VTAIRMFLRKLRADQRGATAIEYGLICSLIVVAAMGGFTALGGSSSSGWGKLETQIAAHM